MFKTLYESFCGTNTDPAFADGSIFSLVGVITLLLSLVISAIFYIWLGNWKNVWYKRKHWWATMFILAVFAFFIALFVSKTETQEVSFTTYMYRLAITNAILSALYFFLSSLLFKRFSIYSKRTPF